MKYLSPVSSAKCFSSVFVCLEKSCCEIRGCTRANCFAHPLDCDAHFSICILLCNVFVYGDLSILVQHVFVFEDLFCWSAVHILAQSGISLFLISTCMSLCTTLCITLHILAQSFFVYFNFISIFLLFLLAQRCLCICLCFCSCIYLYLSTAPPLLSDADFSTPMKQEKYCNDRDLCFFFSKLILVYSYIVLVHCSPIVERCRF